MDVREEARISLSFDWNVSESETLHPKKCAIFIIWWFH